MARWRPPAPGSSAIITAAGMQRLKAELDELWRHQRPEVVRALAAAAAEGDRSENAEYTYRKKQLGEIDRRVRYLSKRIPSLRVIESSPSDPSQVYFGAEIEITDQRSTCFCYRIVGPDETDAGLGHISIDSLLARAALKCRPGDRFEVELPAGRSEFLIVAVHYPSARER